jgi:hypothetical protein
MNHHGKEIDVKKKSKFQILKLSPKRNKKERKRISNRLGVA